MLERYSNHQIKQLRKYIIEAIKKVKAEIPHLTTTDYGTARYYAIIQSLQTALAQTYGDFSAAATKGVDQFTQYQSEFTLKALGGAVAANVKLNVPDYKRIANQALATKIPFTSNQHSVHTALDAFGKAKSDQIVNEIALASSLGESPGQITSRVIGIQTLQKRQAATLVRTINAHLASYARMQTLQANQDVLDGWIAVATLDSHTTLICMGKDGHHYTWSDPQPPYHYNCRTVISPVVKQQYSLPVQGTRAARGPSGKTEQVSGKSTYQSWLKKQPADFQKEVLGEERYKLFTKGGLSLSKFTDSADNTYTLDQLKKLEPLAFKRAGI